MHSIDPGLVSALLGAARAAWPDVCLEDREFARCLTRRLPAASFGGAGSGEKHYTDLFLACACGSGNPAALHHLETKFLRRLPRVLSRINPCPSFADEVLQLLRLKLLVPDVGAEPRILDYNGRGSLSGWLRAGAVRTALNLRESGWREQELDSVIERDLIDSSNAEGAVIKGQLREHLKPALADALGSLNAEERNLLRLHILHALSIDRLAVMFQIHRSTVARRIQRLQGQLLDRVRTQLSDVGGLDSDEVDSALRLIRSGRDLSPANWLG